MKITRLLGWQDLRERGIRWSRQHALVQEKRGKFPQRVRLGPNSIAWREDEIERWLQERSAARTGPPTRWAAPRLDELEALMPAPPRLEVGETA
jgi:prophage regulatory protein